MTEVNFIFESTHGRKSCFVSSCGRKDLRLYSFPCPLKQKERYIGWANACQNPRIRNSALQNIRKNIVVCEIHFTEADFMPRTNRKLYRHSVPSLHLPPKVEEYTDPVSLPQDVDLPNKKPDKSLTDIELHLEVPLKDIPYICEANVERVAMKTVSEGMNSILDSTPDKLIKLPKFVRKKRSKLKTETNQFDEIVESTDFKPIPILNCRICLAYTMQTFSLIEKPQIAEMLESLISIKILNTDLLPTTICLKCLLNLKLAYNIQQKMLKAEQNLQEKLKNFECHESESELTQSDSNIIQVTEDFILTRKPLLTNKTKRKRKANSENIPIDSEKKSESCPLCNKKIFNLENHMKGHSTNSSLCEICGVAMPALNLRIHKIKEHKVYTFKCQFCSKIFPTKCRKEVHEARDHTGQPSYMCDICGKRFYIAKYLQIHVRNIHQNKRPYVCEICSATYRNFYTLSIHQRVHTTLKPFECQICYKKFKHKQKLKTHLLNVHEIMEDLTWKCNECGRLCSTETTLTTHKRIHF